jgi:hypothetical protein
MANRRWGALVPVLWCGILAGCAGPEMVRSTSALDRLPAGPNLGKDIIQMDVVLLERPVGDPFINKELWDFTDEQVVGMDHKAALDDNGFRVGQIVGMPPGRLQSLLTSERSCINPRRRLLPSGRATTQYLGPPLARTNFQVKENGQAITVALDQAQFLLEVIPTLTNDGRTRLLFTPKAQYGENIPDPKPAADGSGWTFQVSKPSKSFAGLNWEVTLAPNEFLVVGANFGQPEALGYQALVQDDGPEPVQRLLVIRTTRSTHGSDASATLEDLARVGQSPPLAMQATMAAVRARGQ